MDKKTFKKLLKNKNTNTVKIGIELGITSNAVAQTIRGCGSRRVAGYISDLLGIPVGLLFWKYRQEIIENPDLIDKDWRDDEGNSLLHFAISNKEPKEVIAAIIKAKDLINLQNKKGERAIDIAKTLESDGVIKLLIINGG